MLVIAGVLCALGLSTFWLVDFHALRSQSVANHTLTTLSSGSAQAAQPGVDVQLVVVGEGALPGMLRRALATSLAAEPAFGEVTLLDAVPERASGPVLVVEISQQDTRWTPIYARSAVSAQVAFSLDGNLSWREQQMVGLQPGDGPWARGEFTLADVSWGLASRPGYQHLLAEKLASQIAGGLAGVVGG